MAVGSDQAERAVVLRPPLLVRLGLKAIASSELPRAKSISEIWSRQWFALNEFAAHMTLVVAIMAAMAGVHAFNLWLVPHTGVLLYDHPPVQIPLDWFISAVDA